MVQSKSVPRSVSKPTHLLNTLRIRNLLRKHKAICHHCHLIKAKVKSRSWNLLANKKWPFIVLQVLQKPGLVLEFAILLSHLSKLGRQSKSQHPSLHLKCKISTNNLPKTQEEAAWKTQNYFTNENPPSMQTRNQTSQPSPKSHSTKAKQLKNVLKLKRKG